MLHYQLLPEDRLAELMADLFGVKLAAATIARMSRTCAERLRGFAGTVRDLVAGAPLKHMDETGFRIPTPLLTHQDNLGSYDWIDIANDRVVQANIARHLAGLANHGGGYLLFGFHDSRAPNPSLPYPPVS